MTTAEAPLPPVTTAADPVRPVPYRRRRTDEAGPGPRTHPAEAITAENRPRPSIPPLPSYSGHPAPAPETLLFCDRQGRPLKYRNLVTILHRLSGRATLTEHRRVHPHALRHYAAKSWLRGGAGLDEVRRLLGHESLDTTLRYSRLVGADLARAHRAAGGIERLGLD